nr:whirlin-like [Aotus nancymaae]
MNAPLDGLSVSSSSTGSLGSAAGAGGGGGAGLRLLSANVRQLHQALTALLSEAEREQFTHCLNAYHARRNVFDLVRTLRVLLDSPVKRRLLPMLRLVIPRSDQLLFDQYTAEGLYLPATTPYRQPAWGGPDGAGPGEVRLVSLRRAKAHEGLGFSIRGGSEHGVGIYVSLVEPGSLAEKEGLRVGDQILRVNDKSLARVTHAEAVKVNLVLGDGRSLGLTIRGGAEYGLGIYITGVDPGSEAEGSGLKGRPIECLVQEQCFSDGGDDLLLYRSITDAGLCQEPDHIGFIGQQAIDHFHANAVSSVRLYTCLYLCGYSRTLQEGIVS